MYGSHHYTLFLIRTSKFCLRLAVPYFFSFLRLKCSVCVLISRTEPCNAAKKNVRLTTIKTHCFISFIFFLSSSAHRQRLGSVLQKSRSATVLKPIKKFDQKIPAKEFNFPSKSATLLKLNSFTGIFLRFWTQMQLYTL